MSFIDGCEQVEKAARSEQHVAVCVLEVHGRTDAKQQTRQYLLVQRPKQGLLAGSSCYPILNKVSSSWLPRNGCPMFMVQS